VVLDGDLKREYQSFLQDHNRDRPDSDGRPDRDAAEIAQWAQQHDLPYFDDTVHFPDVRIEYEVDGRARHEDVEVLTPHYRGAHLAGRAKSGFRCYSAGGSGRSGGKVSVHPAEDLLSAGARGSVRRGRTDRVRRRSAVKKSGRSSPRQVAVRRPTRFEGGVSRTQSPTRTSDTFRISALAPHRRTELRHRPPTDDRWPCAASARRCGLRDEQ